MKKVKFDCSKTGSTPNITKMLVPFLFLNEFSKFSKFYRNLGLRPITFKILSFSLSSKNKTLFDSNENFNPCMITQVWNTVCRNKSVEKASTHFWYTIISQRLLLYTSHSTTLQITYFVRIMKVVIMIIINALFVDNGRHVVHSCDCRRPSTRLFIYKYIQKCQYLG